MQQVSITAATTANPYLVPVSFDQFMADCPDFLAMYIRRCFLIPDAEFDTAIAGVQAYLGEEVDLGSDRISEAAMSIDLEDDHLYGVRSEDLGRRFFAFVRRLLNMDFT